MPAYALIAFVFFILISVPGSLFAATDIGDATVVSNSVTGSLGTERYSVKVGDDVHRDEVIETGDEAVAEFKLADETHLALGANSQLILNELVYNPDDTSAGTMAISALTGTFRFVSGLTPKDNVEIKTPTSTLGIRGTVFDVHVAANGDTTIALIEGQVNVCNPSQSRCRLLRRTGYLMQVTGAGLISEPLRGSSDLLKGIGFASAFPFISQKIKLSQQIRYSKVGLKSFGVPLEKASDSTKETLKKVSQPFQKTLKKVKSPLGVIKKSPIRKLKVKGKKKQIKLPRLLE